MEGKVPLQTHIPPTHSLTCSGSFPERAQIPRPSESHCKSSPSSFLRRMMCPPPSPTPSAGTFAFVANTAQASSSPPKAPPGATPWATAGDAHMTQIHTSCHSPASQPKLCHLRPKLCFTITSLLFLNQKNWECHVNPSLGMYQENFPANDEGMQHLRFFINQSNLIG